MCPHRTVTDDNPATTVQPLISTTINGANVRVRIQPDAGLDPRHLRCELDHYCDGFAIGRLYYLKNTQRFYIEINMPIREWPIIGHSLLFVCQ